jgi:hypothetical protein
VNGSVITSRSGLPVASAIERTASAFTMPTGDFRR